jgi:integrase
MVEWVNLKLTDKYADFYNLDNIQKICKFIKEKNDVKGNTKRKYARYLREFIEYAPVVNSAYQTNLTKEITDFNKTSAIDTKGHMQYTREHLIQIFDPSQPFFNENEDQFWFVIIALFTGARRNAATTLQYGDVINKDGIDCIQFRRNHKIKQLKTDESERFVPIAKQLLDLGFVEYVKRRKTKLKAKDTDFIFPNCQRRDGKYNTNIVQKGFLQYVKDLGIKQPGGEQYDFHSLRNNAAEILQKAGVDIIFINKIIGWKGQNTMLAHYSKRGLADIKTEVDKLRYDFLQPEFDYWKKVMAKK